MEAVVCSNTGGLMLRPTCRFVPYLSTNFRYAQLRWRHPLKARHHRPISVTNAVQPKATVEEKPKIKFKVMNPFFAVGTLVCLLVMSNRVYRESLPASLPPANLALVEQMPSSTVICCCCDGELIHVKNEKKNTAAEEPISQTPVALLLWISLMFAADIFDITRQEREEKRWKERISSLEKSSQEKSSQLQKSSQTKSNQLEKFSQAKSSQLEKSSQAKSSQLEKSSQAKSSKAETKDQLVIERKGDIIINVSQLIIQQKGDTMIDPSQFIIQRKGDTMVMLPLSSNIQTNDAAFLPIEPLKSTSDDGDS